MPATPKEIFERYVWTGMTRNADARAEMFAVDGVLEVPLAPLGGHYPRRLEGREVIRAFMAAEYQRTVDRKVNLDESRYVLHTTADPDVFIAEIDTVLDTVGAVALVYIFRMHDGQITLLRDYFAPELSG